jgi:hypothetical protein
MYVYPMVARQQGTHGKCLATQGKSGGNDESGRLNFHAQNWPARFFRMIIRQVTIPGDSFYDSSGKIQAQISDYEYCLWLGDLIFPLGYLSYMASAHSSCS